MCKSWNFLLHKSWKLVKTPVKFYQWHGTHTQQNRSRSHWTSKSYRNSCSHMHLLVIIRCSTSCTTAVSGTCMWGSHCAEAHSFYQEGSSLLLRHQGEHDPTDNQESTLLITFEEFYLIHSGTIGGISSFLPLEHTPKQNSFIWLDTSHVLQLQVFIWSKKFLSFIGLKIIQENGDGEGKVLSLKPQQFCS